LKINKNKLDDYKSKTLTKFARICDESEQEIARLRSELAHKNTQHAQLEAKYIKDIKGAKKEVREEIELQYRELYNAKFQIFDIEKQEMFDEMRELKEKIRQMGIPGFESEDEQEDEQDKEDEEFSLDYYKSKKTMKMSKYKSLIHEKFEEIAKERSDMIAKNYELKKENDMIEAEYQSVLFSKESLKQELDSKKTEILRLETKIRTLQDQNDELDRENDVLEGRLLKIALK
jgi:chromosome segregation ATPase